jgi:hypothetical protein
LKLKEIPPFISNVIKLSALSAEKLNQTDPKKEIPVVVSLTTIPSRIKKVNLTIRSILNQTKKPKKVLLWLPINLKEKIPNSLRKLEKGLFEIRFADWDSSHLKLIESIKAFPEDNIITIDDDLMYPPEFLELLYLEHLKYPKDILANQAREIRFSDQKSPLAYIEWEHIYTQPKNPKYIMPLGVFGVLYPPKCLDEQVFDVELFKKLAPKADDLWFKAMSLLKNTVSRVTDKKPRPPVLILGTQKIALKRTNKLQDYNRLQWIQLTEKFKF